MLAKLLIANRGEIACRIMRTCTRLGIRTVAVYSEADADALHVRLADEAWPIGGSRPAESYLVGERIIDVALRSGADAIHPGYGFLSENAGFARAVASSGLIFVGPRPESIEAMGSKAGAKALMIAHGVPCVPGYHGEDQSLNTLAAEAQRTGFPLMIKAAAGGGGKGMRIVREASAFADALASAQREAQSGFGDARVILERYVETPRHIEVQVFGDSHGNVVHLNERECSAQRRYQKVLEECPSPFVDATRRAAMGEAAMAAARSVDYVGAGTVEFIVGADGEFFFMEMNTRLQVEHPVTELTTGLDLVELQLRIASGEALPQRLLTEGVGTPNGHAIELRLYAEDPDRNFLPGSGRLNRLRLPAASTHVRIDSGVQQGDNVSIFYDPMIAKLIVWDQDRPRALQRMREALASCEIEGPRSNIEFLEALVRHGSVTGASIDTGYLDRHLGEFLGREREHPELLLAAACTAALLADEIAARRTARNGTDPHSPWATGDAWRIGHAGKRVECFVEGESRLEFSVHGHAGTYRIEWDAHRVEVVGARMDDGVLTARMNDSGRRFLIRVDEDSTWAHDGEHRLQLRRARPYAFEGGTAKGGNTVQAPMPGRIVALRATIGTEVAEGAEVVIMEAMKMELTLRAPAGGVVEAIQCSEGEFVEADSVLVRIKTS